MANLLRPGPASQPGGTASANLLNLRPASQPAGAPGAPHPQSRRPGNGNPIVYLSPSLVIFGLFLFLPLVAVAVLSLFDWNLISNSPRFVGFSNYSKVVLSPTFLPTLRQTGLYLLFGLIGNFAIPVLLAALTLAAGRKTLEIYRTVFFVPSVVASAVGAIIWQYLFLPGGGPINTALAGIGFPGPNWLNDPNTVIPAVALVSSWNTFGFNYIIALSGFSAIPVSLIEAAQLDGAHGWRMLTRVSIPLASPTLVFIAAIALLQALAHAFVPLQMMTGGGPNNASTNLFFEVYQTAFKFFQVGESAAGAVLLVGLLSIAAIIQFKITDKKATHGSY